MSAVLRTASMFDRWLRRHYSAAGSDLAELACLGSDRLERMVEDARLSASQSRGMASGDTGGDDLLRRRMTALRLDADEMSRLEPAMFRDLQRLCALCASRNECRRDLATDSSNLSAQDWLDYCPNGGTLNMLVALDSYSHIRI